MLPGPVSRRALLALAPLALGITCEDPPPPTSLACFDGEVFAWIEGPPPALGLVHRVPAPDLETSVAGDVPGEATGVEAFARIECAGTVVRHRQSVAVGAGELATSEGVQAGDLTISLFEIAPQALPTSLAGIAVEIASAGAIDRTYTRVTLSGPLWADASSTRIYATDCATAPSGAPCFPLSEGATTYSLLLAPGTYQLFFESFVGGRRDAASLEAEIRVTGGL